MVVEHFGDMAKLTRRQLTQSVLASAAIAPSRVFATSPTGQASTVPSGTLTDSGVTDSEIVLGVSTAFKGPSRGLGIELYRGAVSYFAHVNDQGGVHGRRIVLKLRNDGYQPVPAVENSVKLIVDDKVFALFGYVGTPTVTRVLPVLKKFQDRDFLLFFPFTGAQPQRQPPYDEFAFNLRASYKQETAGLVDNFIAIGRERIAVFYQADAYGRSGWAGVRAALKEYDKKLVGEATYRRGEQYTAVMRAQVERLKKVNPDAVICIGSYAACAAFARDAIDGGLEIPIANLSFVGSENLLKNLTDEFGTESERYSRWLVNSQVVPSYEDFTMGSISEYEDLMKRYDPTPPPEFEEHDYVPFAKSFTSLEGFLNAKLMTEILKRAGPSPSRALLEDAVFSIQNHDLGIGEMVHFSPERRQGLDQVYYTIVDNNRFVGLTDWEAKFAT